MRFLVLSTLLLLPLNTAPAQHTAEPEAATESTQPAESPPESTAAENSSEASNSDALDQAKETASGLVGDAKERVGDLADTLDQNRTVRDMSSSLLYPIYVAAETIAFPAFHWLAFCLMAAGTVSYALQLVLGKLVVLARGSFSLREILSDGVGLLISVVGLILTTQAAAENSTFPESPTAVLSSAIVGAILGLVLYRWNQSEEIDAAHGRRRKRD